MNSSDPTHHHFPGHTPSPGDVMDNTLALDEFRRGFTDAVDYLSSLPGTWACHHASSILEQPASEVCGPSHARGYRAALFGYLRGGPLYDVAATVTGPVGDAVPALGPV